MAVPYEKDYIASRYITTANIIKLQARSGKWDTSATGPRALQNRDFGIATSLNKTVAVQAFEQAFTAPVFVANQRFDLIVDTGSSETWVADRYYTCVYDGSIFPSIQGQDFCALGQTFDRGLDYKVTYLDDPTSFYVGYGDFSSAAGELVLAPVQIGNNDAIKSNVGLASLVSWTNGDNHTSGILGLGGRELTRSFAGSDVYYGPDCSNTTAALRVGSTKDACTSTTHQVLIDFMFKHSSGSSPDESTGVSNTSNIEGQKAYFALALSRSSKNGTNAGFLTVGGTPDYYIPEVNVSSKFAAVPFETTRFRNVNYSAGSFYAISIDSLILPAYFNATATSTKLTSSYMQTPTANSTIHQSQYKKHRLRSATNRQVALDQKNGKSQFIVDSGTSIITLASEYAELINSFFQPPAYRQYYNGLYRLNCSALESVPNIGFVVGGQTFYLNPEDMVLRSKGQSYDYYNGTYVDTEICISAFQEAAEQTDGTTIGILGQPFLKNVLAVFDVGAQQLGLASRLYYKT